MQRKHKIHIQLTLFLVVSLILLSSFVQLAFAAATGTVGNPNTGSSYSTEAPVGDIIFQNFTAPASSTLLYNVSWYGRASSGTVTWAGIIATLSGTTMTVLTNGQTANASAGTTAGWQTASFSTPPTLTPATVYWFGIECGTTAVLRFYYSATSGGYEEHGTAASWVPATITSMVHSNDTNYCIYGNDSISTNTVVKPTFSTTTSWNEKDKWSAKDSMSFSTTATWNEKDKWAAKNQYSFSTTFGVGETDKWASKNALTFGSTFSTGEKDLWAAKIPSSFSSSTTWSSGKNNAHFSILPSFSTIFSNTNFVQWKSNIGASFSSSTTWNLLAPWTSHINLSLPVSASWSILPAWFAHINLSAALSTTWNAIAFWAFGGSGGANSSDAQAGIAIGLMVFILGTVGFVTFYLRRRNSDGEHEP